jgi:hypothetical protein
MIWLAIVVVLVLAVVLAVIANRSASPSDPATYRAAVELHAARRRQEVSQVKTEIRRDAAQMRRRLRVELNERKRGRS